MKRVIILIAIISIYLSLYAIFSNLKIEKKVELEGLKEEIITKVNITTNRSVILFIPAVDNNGNGIMTKLIVEAKPGNGKVLIDIDNLFFWIDTQQSIRTAKKVAEKYLKMNLSNYDLIYKIETNAQVVGGPSAGAAITIATILALLDKQPNKNVSITGTINEDGTIGQVGAVYEKAKAAKDFGIKIFLVPKDQSIETELIPKKECTKVMNFEFCTITYEVNKINIGEKVGIKVIEVSNIEEAIKYFL